MARPSPLTARELGGVVALIERGRPGEAERAARALLEHHPGAGLVWKILSVALVRQGKDALPALYRAAELLPADAEAHCNLGAALHDRGQWAEALASFGRVLALEPGHLGALVDAANALKALGRAAEAVAFYQRALALDATLEEAHNNLGNALLELNRYEEAAACYRRALDFRPGDAVILTNLAAAERHQGRTDQALAVSAQALAADPGLALAHTLRGDLLRELGHRGEALAHYARAAELEPGRPEHHCNLGSVLFELRRIGEAAASHRRALALAPRHAAAHLQLALALRQQRRPEEAQASCREALAIDPDYAEALSFLGELEADRGRFAAAEQLFRRAIASDPALASAYAGIATHRRMTPDDSAWRASVETLLARPPPLGAEITLRYALGKYFDDLGQADAAFAEFRRANELTKRYGASYQPARFSAFIDELIGRFDDAYFRERRERDPGPSPARSATTAAPASPAASELPVFIVGMPRSGTSLAEQILASHPAVVGAGEVTFWHAAYRAYHEARRAGGDEAAMLARLGADFLEHLSRSIAEAAPAGPAAAPAPAPARIVDKMPANFLYAGLIHAVFPTARIIHMQRHPLDTCLSIYCQNFFNLGPHANDLGDLAHYYGEYRRISAHWRRTLPAKALLEVPYESLIDDLPHWSRRMLEFIGLPWDPRCLEFDKTERVVITASKWQVRQKITKSSAGRWRRYERHLTSLRPLLSIVDS